MQWKKDGANFVTLYKYDSYYRLTAVYYNYGGSLVHIVYPQTANVTYSYLNGTSMKATANGTSSHIDHDGNTKLNCPPSLQTSNLASSILGNIPITGRQTLTSNLQHPTSSPAWDASGNRITFSSSTRINDADKFSFVYDITASVPAVTEEIAPGGTSILYIREPAGGLLARVTGTGASESIQYYHFDELGSTRFLTSTDGVITDKYTYDAHGNITSHTGGTQQPYQYVGKYGYYTHYQDQNLPYIQTGFRLYSPGLGRYIQEDPIQQGVNWYGYSNNNPLTTDANLLSAINSSGLRHAARTVKKMPKKGKSRIVRVPPRRPPLPSKPGVSAGKIAGAIGLGLSLGCTAAILGDIGIECGSNPLDWTPECICKAIKDLKDNIKLDKKKPAWKQIGTCIGMRCANDAWTLVSGFCK